MRRLSPLNRRKFIKQALAAGSLAAGAGIFGLSCTGLRRGDLPDEAPAGGVAALLDNRDIDILYLASLSPSGHNAQPWFVRPVRKNEWVIGADPARRLPAVDPAQREALLSIGAFIENLATAAGARGLEARIQVLAAEASAEDILNVTLHPAPARDYPLTRITRRRTVRRGLRNDELKSADVKRLEEAAGGHFFYFPQGSDHARCIAEGAVENFRRQSYRDEAQAELVKWLRLDNEQARRHRDGLTTEGMEITGVKGWFVRTFVDPGDFMQESYRRQGVDVAAEQAREGAGWIVITSPGSGAGDLVEAGRRFERMGLVAPELKIGIHPMTQFLEETGGREVIAANHDPKTFPQFILRVGYVDPYPAPVSLRRPVGWFLKG